MRRLNKRRGMTLIEIMVVLIILGLIAGIVAVNMPAFTSRGYQVRIESDLNTIKSAAALYKMNNNRFPTSVSQLAEGNNSPLESVPKDPWGNAYIIKMNGNRVEIWCYGQDGAPGGQTEDDKDYSTGGSTQ